MSDRLNSMLLNPYYLVDTVAACHCLDGCGGFNRVVNRQNFHVNLKVSHFVVGHRTLRKERLRP